MDRFRRNVVFVEPSLLSSILVVITALGILVAANFSFLINSGILYDTLIGQESSYQFIENSKTSFDTWSTVTLGNPVINRILFFGFWFLIGLFMYVSFVSIGQVLGETGHGVAELHYIHARKQFIAQRLLFRFAMRTISILGLTLFSWLMVRLLLPFCVLAVRVGISQLGIRG